MPQEELAEQAIVRNLVLKMLFNGAVEGLQIGRPCEGLNRGKSALYQSLEWLTSRSAT